MEQQPAAGPRWDPGIGAFVEEDDVQFSPDPDRPQPPSSPAAQAAPSAPATGRPLDAATLVPLLDRDAAAHEAIAQGHETRLRGIFQAGQQDVADTEARYAAGEEDGIRGVAGLAQRQTERSLAARQLAGEILRVRQERDKNSLWSGALQLGLIGTAPSAPAPAAVPVAGVPQGDEYADMDDESRRLCGLPPKDEEEAETSEISLLDARLIGLA